MKVETGVVVRLTWAESQALRATLKEWLEREMEEEEFTADGSDVARRLIDELSAMVDGEPIPNPPRRASHIVEAEGTVIKSSGPVQVGPYRVVVDVPGCGSVAFHLDKFPGDLVAGERVVVGYHPEDQIALFRRRV